MSTVSQPPLEERCAPVVESDELLSCLLLLARSHGEAATRDGALAGLPLEQGRLTPALFERAARRVGLASRVVRQSLTALKGDLFPVLLLLQNNKAGLLVGRSEDGQTLQLLYPELGDAPVALPLAQVEAQYTGRAIYARPRLRFDARSPEVRAPRDGHWFWSVIAENRALYRDVLLAAFLTNLFALAMPMFTMNVYDRVVPNQAFETLAALSVGLLLVLVGDLVLRLLRASGRPEAQLARSGAFQLTMAGRTAQMLRLRLARAETVVPEISANRLMVSIRLMQLLSPQGAREWVSRFGFDPERQPDNLTQALGSGSTNPLQMAGAYSVLANGGYRVNPVLIQKIARASGEVVFEAKPQVLDETLRTVPARNTFMVSSLLQEVTRSGTAAKAQAALKRPDLYGKTGTTNDVVDAWFAGYQPGVVAVVWVGYDTPRSLGTRASGSALALPAWIDYMSVALNGVPVQEVQPPEGVVRVGDDWRYAEWAEGGFIDSLGVDGQAISPALAVRPATPPVSPDSQ